MPKENESYKCLSLIMLESVIRTGKKYYPQTFSEECKYKIKKKTVKNLINDDFDTSSSKNQVMKNLMINFLMINLLINLIIIIIIIIITTTTICVRICGYSNL